MPVRNGEKQPKYSSGLVSVKSLPEPTGTLMYYDFVYENANKEYPEKEYKPKNRPRKI